MAACCVTNGCLYRPMVCAWAKAFSLACSQQNVHLEKEVEVLKTNSAPVASLDLLSGTPPMLSRLGAPTGSPLRGGGRPFTAAAAAGGGRSGQSSPLRSAQGDPVAAALGERDATIAQLQRALDAARRRAGLLESQLQAAGITVGLGGGGGSDGAAAGRAAVKAQQEGIREVLAQSALHLSKYKQIREDYNRLLYK